MKKNFGFWNLFSLIAVVVLVSLYVAGAALAAIEYINTPPPILFHTENDLVTLPMWVLSVFFLVAAAFFVAVGYPLFKKFNLHGLFLAYVNIAVLVAAGAILFQVGDSTIVLSAAPLMFTIANRKGASTAPGTLGWVKEHLPNVKLEIRVSDGGIWKVVAVTDTNPSVEKTVVFEVNQYSYENSDSGNVTKHGIVDTESIYTQHCYPGLIFSSARLTNAAYNFVGAYISGIEDAFAELLQKRDEQEAADLKSLSIKVEISREDSNELPAPPAEVTIA
jgi:hypothetical protein